MKIGPFAALTNGHVVTCFFFILAGKGVWIAAKRALFFYCLLFFFFWGGGGHVSATLRLRIRMGIVSWVGYAQISNVWEHV